ncbi:MAG: OmpA family protein [Paludibacteraceae bacterium]|nr:OmpA family protein [Paludibacteraceae bacterium]
MKKLSLLIIILFAALSTMAQVKNYVGLSGEFGYSNLLYKTDAAKNRGGVGGGLEMFYELQAGAFHARTGLGFDLQGSNTLFDVPADALGDANYPTLTYEYHYNDFKQHSRYGFAYVPLMLGAQFGQIYFQVGAKFGLVNFANHYKSTTDMEIIGYDTDILDPISGLPTHNIETYTIKHDDKLDYKKGLNIMLSGEVGMDLDRWLAVQPKPQPRGRGQRPRRKTFRECLHYRAAVFFDYGLSNMYNYAQNVTSNATIGVPNGMMIRHNSTVDKADVTPFHAMGVDGDWKPSKLNNLIVGVKFAIMYEFQKKPAPLPRPVNPMLVAMLRNTKTDKPVGGAKVKITNNKTNRPAGIKTSDGKQGRIQQRLAAGSYTLSATRAGYLNSDTITFDHGTVDDTVFIYMRPQPIFSAAVFDAKTNRPVYAKVDVIDAETGKVVYTSTLDSLKTVASTKLDLQKRYTIMATAPGYMDLRDTIIDVDNEMTLTMEPIIVGKKYILDNMYFATNKTEILPMSEKALQGLYELLSENPDVRIKIIGHTDDVGNDRSNQILSEGRARSVRQSMIERGIEASRIEWEGRGEREPIVPNDSDEHRQMNRRVEIEILSAANAEAIHRANEAAAEAEDEE